MNTESPHLFHQPGATEAGGYVLTLAGLLVAIGLLFHPLPAQGFREAPSILENTPWWGAIHVAIAAGFVLCVLGSLLTLIGGGVMTKHWVTALCWGALTVGMIYFTGVALINCWVLHELSHHAHQEALLYEAMNDLILGFGWLGNPLFLFGLTGIAFQEMRLGMIGMKRWLVSLGLIVSLLSWGRGIGSATGLYFLEPLIFANIPAFLWLGYYGWLMARLARTDNS